MLLREALLPSYHVSFLDFSFYKNSLYLVLRNSLL
jgi:hypothetical protein